MKKYLITLLIIPTLIFADAVIFSGSDVKTLKPNIDLFGVAKILTTSTIPTAGLTAPKGSIAMYTTTGDLYLKTGALNTDWTKNQTGPVSLTTDVTGILPIANGGTGSATQNFVDLTTAQSIAGLKNFTDALTITSNSANSLAVGPNGTTNSVLQIDSSTASAATGLKVTGNSAGSGVLLGTISSGTNEAMNITTKGSGQLSLQVGGANKFTTTQIQNAFTQAASTSASTARFLVTGVADTSLTASTEAPHTYFNIGQTRQHATGALALQRDFRITPSSHSFVGASTLTNAAALAIDGPSNGGTNATITNSSALYIPTSAVTNVTNSYGLNIAATTGATNNYAGIFTGGNVGIGVATPNANAILDVTSTTKAFMPPRMTTAQKNSVASPTAGMVVYDTDMASLSVYNGTAWTTTNTMAVSTKTANYTGLYSDDVILGDATSGAITITLPTAVGFSGKVFNIKKTDSSVNSVTIATTSSQTIDGALTAPLISQYQSLTLVSNGTNWSVL